MSDPGGDTRSMALFCDFENVALGVREARYQQFDISLVLERLLLKGSIVVKKAYCDWERYREFKAAMHQAAFELIEIPHLRMSGKNSADIRMVVDALDLCYTKSHVDTFVIISGDSDFSPLVSKLRENNKTVIGVGVKNSTSELLINNCDEFIYYDDLVRTVRPQRRRPASSAALAPTVAKLPAAPPAVAPAMVANAAIVAPPSLPESLAVAVVSGAPASASMAPPAAARRRRSTRGAGASAGPVDAPATPADVVVAQPIVGAPASVPAEVPSPAPSETGPERSFALAGGDVPSVTDDASGTAAEGDPAAAERRIRQALDLIVDTLDALATERGEDEKIWGSMVKQALRRRKPGFSESYYGFRSFNRLLEEARDRGLIELERDGKSGGYTLRSLV